MNASELAHLMLTWEEWVRHVEKLERQIKEAVLAFGKTVDTGNVRASYSKGRKRYDYAIAVHDAVKAGSLSEDDVKAFEKIVTTVSVDYRSACTGAGLTDIPFTQGEPSVTVKLLS